MRPIDADALWEQMKELHEKRAEEAKFTGDRVVCVTWHDAVIFIKNAPTIDAVPVVHGHWGKIEIIDDDSDSGVNDEAARCSVCKGVQSSYYWATNYYNYCPKCGAKMDEEPTQTQHTQSVGSVEGEKDERFN